MSSPYQSTIWLIERLARLYPHYGPPDLLRMALLLSLHRSGDLGDYWPIDATHAGETQPSDEALILSSQEISLQMQAAGDQHAAVADELDSLAATTPCDFSPAHVFTLVRAIKVQSQVLDLYLGPMETATYQTPRKS